MDLTPVSQNIALPLFLIKTCFPITMFWGVLQFIHGGAIAVFFFKFHIFSRYFTPDVVACSPFDKQIFDIYFLQNPENRDCRLKLRKRYHKWNIMKVCFVCVHFPFSELLTFCVSGLVVHPLVGTLTSLRDRDIGQQRLQQNQIHKKWVIFSLILIFQMFYLSKRIFI